MRELYVYYRVRRDAAAAAESLVHALQRALADDMPGLRARLLTRSDEADGSPTWMEVYCTDPLRQPEGVTHGWQDRIEARFTALLPLLDGARHVEAFVPCAS
jgi:hypothetical protein